MAVGGRRSKLTPRAQQDLLGNIVKAFPYEASEENTNVGSSERELEYRFSDIEMEIVRERLRQARISFQLSWFTTGLCAVIGIGGVVLLMTGNASAGIATTAGGLTATVYCLHLAKDANDRLDQVAKDLTDD